MPSSSLTLELIGAYDGIKFAVKKLQVNAIWVEGDFTTVIQMANK